MKTKTMMLSLLLVAGALMFAPTAAADHDACGSGGGLVDGGCYYYCDDGWTRCYYCELWVQGIGGIWCNPV